MQLPVPEAGWDAARRLNKKDKVCLFTAGTVALCLWGFTVWLQTVLYMSLKLDVLFVPVGFVSCHLNLICRGRKMEQKCYFCYDIGKTNHVLMCKCIVLGRRPPFYQTSRIKVLFVVSDPSWLLEKIHESKLMIISFAFPSVNAV